MTLTEFFSSIASHVAKIPKKASTRSDSIEARFNSLLSALEQHVAFLLQVSTDEKWRYNQSAVKSSWQFLVKADKDLKLNLFEDFKGDVELRAKVKEMVEGK